MAKPRKVEEPAAAYGVAKKSATPRPATGAPAAVRHMDDATFRKAAKKVFKTHEELFRKLAQ